MQFYILETIAYDTIDDQMPYQPRTSSSMTTTIAELIQDQLD